MSVASISTDYLQNSPGIAAKKLDREARLWKVASTVTLIAFAAISTVAMAFALLGTGVFSMPVMVLVFGLALVSPALLAVESIFGTRASAAKELAKIEHGVQQQMDKCANWKDADFQAFAKTHRIQRPLDKQSIPLIARFLYWQQLAEKTQAEAESDFNAAKNIDAEFRFAQRQDSWKTLVYEALPAKLRSAAMLEQIEKNQAVDIEKIGKCHPLFLGEWLSQGYFKEQDHYFTFEDKRPSLSVDAIRTSSIDDLHAQLFRTR